jgi:hypothetical protein
MGVRRGVAPGEREADAASSGLVIADVGVGDPVGIGTLDRLACMKREKPAGLNDGNASFTSGLALFCGYGLNRCYR